MVELVRVQNTSTKTSSLLCSMDLLGSAHSLLGTKPQAILIALGLGSSREWKPSQYDADRNGISSFISLIISWFCYINKRVNQS